MQKTKRSTLRSTLLAALTLTVGSAMAQTLSPITPREPLLNAKIADAAKPYRDNPNRAAESLALFEALNAQGANDPDVQSWLGFLYLQTGAPEKAIAPLELAAEKRKDNLEVRINLGNAYFFSKTPQYDKALDSYGKVIAVRPEMSEPHYNSGVIYLQRRKYAESIKELKIAESLDKDNPYIKNNLGVAYEKTNDVPNAATKFREASALKNEKVFARNAGLAILKQNATDPNRKPFETQAKPYLEKADPNDPAVALALANMVKGSDQAKARALCDQAERNLANPIYARDRETYWFNIGAIRRSAGDNDGAVRAYQRALAIKPDDVAAMKNLGLLRLDRKEYAEAETQFDRLTGFTPNSSEAWRYLAIAATNAHDSDKAIVAYREAVKLGGTDSKEALENLVNLRLGLADELYTKHDPGAAAEYNRVLQMQANNVKALNGLGLIYLEEKKWASAAAVLQSAIKADGTYAPAYNNYAIALDKLFRRKEAIEVLKKARNLKADPEVMTSIQTNLQKLQDAQSP